MLEGYSGLREQFAYLCETSNIELMAVKKCSKALLASTTGNGKSPCFLQVGSLSVLGPDYPSLVLPRVNGEDFLECAF